MNRKLFFIFTLLIISSNLYSQSYLGWVKKKTNLREEPNSSSSLLLSLNPGTQIYIVSLETINEFYNVIDIETNTEGYIAESFIKVGDVVEKSTERLFSPTGKIAAYDPEVEIYNNTDLNLTLKLNDTIYRFSPQERNTLKLSSGFYEFRASAPGVIPVSGNNNLESNMGYSWEFYVITQRR